MKILVIANCHAPILQQVLSMLCPGVEAHSITAHAAKKNKADQYVEQIETHDLILHFLIADSFFCPPLTTSFIKEHYGGKSRTITNLHFNGLHPDTTYVGKLGSRVKGPFGGYHSKICLASHKMGLSKAQILDLMENESLHASLGYDEEFNKSADRLIERDKTIDIPFTETFLKLVARGDQVPLYTFNHPAIFVLVAFAKVIATRMGLPMVNMPANAFPDPLRAQAILPVFPIVKKSQHLAYDMPYWRQPNNKAWLSAPSAVDIFLEFYSASNDDILDFPDLSGVRDQIAYFV